MVDLRRRVHPPLHEHEILAPAAAPCPPPGVLPHQRYVPSLFNQSADLAESLAERDRVDLRLPELLLCAGVSAAVASIVTNPLDVLKLNYQVHLALIQIGRAHV